MFKHFISIVLATTWILVVRVDALPDVIYVGEFVLEIYYILQFVI